MKTIPRKHQQEAYEWMAGKDALSLFHYMRSGKSKLIIDDAIRAYKEGRINAVIVCAPNGVHANWAERELPTHAWDDIEWDSWIWRTTDKTSEQRFYEAWKKKALVFYCVPHHSIRRDDLGRILWRILHKRKVYVVFDESHAFAQPGSKQTKRAVAIARHCPVRRIMTGSPLENRPFQAYSQFNLLKPHCLGFKRYKAFEQKYGIFERGMRAQRDESGEVERVIHFPKLVGYQNLDDLRKRIAPYCHVVTREMIEDMPSFVRSTREVVMTERQARIYDEIRDGIVADVEGEKVSIGSMSPRWIKLQQILSGFLVDKSYAPWEIQGPNPRIKALVDEVISGDGRVLVWCAFQRDIDQCTAALQSAGRHVVQYHGRASDREKAKARELMRYGTDPYGPDLVGHPQSGGVGLNLAGASRVIWYSHTFDAVVRMQADERATEVGGGNVSIVDLVGVHPMPGRRTIDHTILVAQESKTDVADYLSRQGLMKVINSL